MYSQVIYDWLNTALDMGISELDFWSMTIAELERSLQSKARIKKQQAQEQATYDYILADLIGRSISRIYSASNKMPTIYDTYPTLFDSEEIEQKKQEKQAELSVLRFKQFANSYNRKYKEVRG